MEDGTARGVPASALVVWLLTPRRLQAIRSFAERYGCGAEVLDRLQVAVKDNLIEKHFIHFARWYGTGRRFGEDGLEALHPNAEGSDPLHSCTSKK